MKQQHLRTMLKIMADGKERTTTAWRIEAQKHGIGDVSRYLRWARNLGLVHSAKIPSLSREKYWNITERGKQMPEIKWVQDITITRPVLREAL